MTRRSPGLLRGLDATLGGRSGLGPLVAGFAVAGVLQGLACAALIPILGDVADGEVGVAWWWLLGGAAAMALHGVVLWSATARGYRVAFDKIGGRLAQRLGQRVVALPLGWFHGRRTAEVSTLLTRVIGDSGSLPGLLIQQVTLAIATPATIVVVVAVIDPLVAAALIVAAPGATVLFGRIRRAAAVPDDSDTEVTARLLEYARAQRVLRAAGRSANGWDTLVDALDDDRRATLARLDREARPLRGYVALAGAGLALAVIALAYRARHGLPVGEAIAVGVLVVRFVEPVTILAGYAIGLGLGDRALTQIDDVLRTPPLPVVEPSGRPDPAHPVAVELDDVHFAYGTTPALNGMSLTIPTGSVMAIVGPSGSGKTTITRLVARFYDTAGGTVRVGGVDVRAIPPDALMAQLAMVFQDVYLFDASIADNVRLARPDATDPQLAEAARLARLTDVIDRLPDGWNTRVGEGGARLSAGERQRVAIARALLKDAPVLLLDEATAAIDAVNEAALTDTIAHLAAHCTILVIAHRLSTIATADQIAVVVDGAIEQVGTHADLLTADGTYARFWRKRQSSTGWTITDRTG